MTYKHKKLVDGAWDKMSYLEQLANIGSEVFRATRLNEYDNKNNAEGAFIRSLELFDLTLNSNLTSSQLRQIARAREIWVDFFRYDNIYKTDAKFWNDYFLWLLVYYKRNPKRYFSTHHIVYIIILLIMQYGIL